MNLLQIWTEMALHQFLPVSVFWLLCLAVAHLVRNRYPAFAYWLVLLSLIRPFVPWRWQLPSIASPLGARFAALPVTIVNASSRPGFSLMNLLFIVWLGIGLLLTVLFLTRIKTLEHRARAFTRRQSAVLEDIARRLGLRQTPTLYSDPGIRMPFTWGIRKPAIAVTEELISWDDAHRAPVLAHEAAHIARGDNLALLCENLVTIVFFFHPALWLLRRFLRMQREILADRTALSLTGNDPVAYGRTLLKNARLCLAGSGIGNHLAQSRLKARITWLVRLKEATMPAFNKYQKLILVILFAALFLLSAGRFRPVDANQLEQIPGGQAELQLPLPHLAPEQGSELRMGDKIPQVLHQVQPKYPQSMKQEGWMAEVKLVVAVDQSGKVTKVRSALTRMTRDVGGKTIVRLSELKNNPFAQAAIGAVELWRFAPPGRDIEVMLPVNFKLQ